MEQARESLGVGVGGRLLELIRDGEYLVHQMLVCRCSRGGTC